jgi:UDP-GlcNAc3NAcA epimerase
MPEEINRVVTDHISTQLYCPTEAAVANLLREGINDGVHAVGDVMYDMCLASARRAEQFSVILKTLNLAPQSYAVATIHRAENTDDAAQFVRVVDWLVRQAGDRPIIMPVHPRTAKLFSGLDRNLAGIRIISPVGYLDMTRLVQQSAAVFTDSGGLQKEAYFHRVPCVTLRTETEWGETVAAGWNRLWTCDRYEPRREIADYGDGNASEKIASVIAALSAR